MERIPPTPVSYDPAGGRLPVPDSPRVDRRLRRGPFVPRALVAALVVAGGLAPAPGEASAQAQEPAAEGTRPGSLASAFVASPILARGSLLLEVDPGAVSFRRLYPDGSGEGPDRFLLLPAIGTDQAPALEPSEARFRSLAGDPDAPGIVLGATRGRITADEQVLPMRLYYGVLDRVTVGLTVPVVRRRVEAHLRLSPEGANVGRNPALADNGTVADFLAQSESALAQLEAAVDDWCAQAGEADPRCTEGRALVADLGGFLGGLSTAYEEEALFPLASGDLGGLLSVRWGSFRIAAAEWNVTPPEALPLASAFLDDDALRSEVVEPAWGPGGFPMETPRTFLLLGDVEAHVALALLHPQPDPRNGIRIRSSLVGTVRFPTGRPDSLRIVAPLDPPRGAGGLELRSVTDLLLPGRFAVLAVVEFGTAGSRDLVLLAPDPSRPFVPGATRTRARWSPGDHLRVALTPRFHLHRNLSVGLGWRYLARKPDRYESLEPDGPPIFEADRGPRLHHVAFELRYSAMEPPASEGTPLPLEVRIRLSRTVSGSGPLAPDERRIEVGGRVVLRR